VDKRRTLTEAAGIVGDGTTIAIGGLSMNCAPMALVRELVRRGVRDLTVVAIVAGMPIDWLVAGGCVSKVITGLVSFEGLGLAPHFRSAVQRGEVEVEEYSEHTLICRLQAAAHGLPFVPTKAGLGTDMIGLHPETTRHERDAVTGEHYVACTPLPVDVALVHAHAADIEGNVRVDPKLIWMDNELVHAARSTVVSVEEIVPHRSFVDEPHRTTYPRFVVDAVVDAPYGAYPTSNFPRYTYHAGFFDDYVRAARDPESWEQFWKTRVLEPDGQGDLLDANGGPATLIEIAQASR
jgi:glutaconate CoA-transferase subunit A